MYIYIYIMYVYIYIYIIYIYIMRIYMYIYNVYTSFCSRFKIRLNVKHLHKHSSIRWPPNGRAIHRRRKVRSPEGVVWEHVGGEDMGYFISTTGDL